MHCFQVLQPKINKKTFLIIRRINNNGLVIKIDEANQKLEISKSGFPVKLKARFKTFEKRAFMFCGSGLWNKILGVATAIEHLKETLKIYTGKNYYR